MTSLSRRFSSIGTFLRQGLYECTVLCSELEEISMRSEGEIRLLQLLYLPCTRRLLPLFTVSQPKKWFGEIKTEMCMFYCSSEFEFILMITVLYFIYVMFIKIIIQLLVRSEEHTSELQSHLNLVCRLLL